MNFGRFFFSLKNQQTACIYTLFELQPLFEVIYKYELDPLLLSFIVLSFTFLFLLLVEYFFAAMLLTLRLL